MINIGLFDGLRYLYSNVKQQRLPWDSPMYVDRIEN